MNPNTLSVLVQNREGILYQGPAQSLTSYNPKGKFDLLPQHANFISLVEQGLSIKKEDGTTQEIPLKNGILRVVQNQVEIYLGIKQ